MGYFINADLGYYEGDQIDPFDTAVSRRPDATYQWLGGAWTLTLAQAKANALATLASNRYAAQTGGTTISGMSVKTDPDSLTLIAGAKSYVDAIGTAATVQFKTSSGVFVSLTQAQVDAIALAVGQHVQGCFSSEATIAAQINAASTVEAVQAINLNTGWPA